MGERMSAELSEGEGMDQGADELRLSPSETLAHNSAMRISGAARRDDPGSKTQRALASIVLGFELIVVVLIGLTIFGLGLLEPRELGLWIAGGLALVCVAALALMRVGRAGIWLGWIAHALMLATGFILLPALVVGAIFTALWIYCMVKGARIDRDRVAWLAAQEPVS